MPRKPSNRPPTYRHHKQSGQAITTLVCRVSGKRRDVLLGAFDSPESRVAYAEAIARWERDGRVLDNRPKPEPIRHDEVTVAEVLLNWWEGVLKRYNVTDPEGRLPSRLYAERSVVRLTRATCGSLPASKFGPLALQQVREKMVGKGWSRGHVNGCVAVIIRAFREAVAREVIKPEAVVALECVKPLRRGEAGTAEGRKVTPVALADVEAVKPHLSRQVRAIIDTMLLTGARCGEVCQMRPIDIDVSGAVWTYRPAHHKTEHHGRDRLIHIGPKAQRIIEPFMAGRPTHAYLFSPAEAETERRQAQHDARVTPLSYGNRPGTNRVDDPKRQPGDQFTTDALRRAVGRACDAAFTPPARLQRQRIAVPGRKSLKWETPAQWKARLGPKLWAELAKWKADHRWSPHQLRHTAATSIRRAAGVEAAAIVLGHSSATLTDQVYAQRHTAKAAEVIALVG